MGVVAKNLIPQLVQSSAELAPVSALSLDDSPSRIPIAELHEVREISRFLRILFLVHKTSFTDGAVPHKNATSKSVIQRSLAVKLLRQLGKTVQQLNSAGTEGEVMFGHVMVNFSTMEASRSGESVALTAMEFKVLKYMIRNERRVISRDELLQEVWGYENYPCTRTVDNHILKLRKKLEQEPSRPQHFRTVHGVGYKFLS